MPEGKVKTGFWDWMTGQHTDTSPKPGEPGFVGPTQPKSTEDFDMGIAGEAARRKMRD